MSNIKQITCIACPRGCRITITVTKNEPGSKTQCSVGGNACAKGEKYGIQETICPMRIVTSTIASSITGFPRVPVKTDCEVPLAHVMEVMGVVKSIRVDSPVHCGQILYSGIAGTTANLVATEDCE